jgi:hypothetical protein
MRLTEAAIFSKPPVNARARDPSVMPHTLWVSSTDLRSTTDLKTGEKVKKWREKQGEKTNERRIGMQSAPNE